MGDLGLTRANDLIRFGLTRVGWVGQRFLNYLASALEGQGP